MNKDIIQNEIAELSKIHNNMLLTLSTGVGKSRAFIKIQTLQPEPPKTLLVVAERAHIDNWIEEYNIFNREPLKNTTIICYASLHKYSNSSFDIICLDEVHHLTAKRCAILNSIKAKKVFGLSATMDQQKKDAFRLVCLCLTNHNFFEYKISLNKAIKNNLLPVPVIIPMTLTLDDTLPTEIIEIKKGSKRPATTVSTNLKSRGFYLKKYKEIKLICACTQKEKYLYLCEQMDSARQRYMCLYKQYLKNAWLQWGLKRKRYLAELKTNVAKTLLKSLPNKRILIFCGSIAQANALGAKKNIINSQVSNCEEIIKNFNSGKIDTLFCVNMLREGQNLQNVDLGIIIQLDGVDISFYQRVGRCLRSVNPEIYVLYYKGTKDEEYWLRSIEKIDLIYIKNHETSTTKEP